jgi:hypothetical protein
MNSLIKYLARKGKVSEGISLSEVLELERKHMVRDIGQSHWTSKLYRFLLDIYVVIQQDDIRHHTYISLRLYTVCDYISVRRGDEEICKITEDVGGNWRKIGANYGRVDQVGKGADRTP